MDTQQFCTFKIDTLVFGVDVRLVQEVIRYQVMTQVPLASKVVRGLINLRGQIVTAIDLRRRLELQDSHSDRPPMNVVIRTDDEAVSLLVDEIGEVIEVTDETLEPPPSTIEGVAGGLIAGVYKLEDYILLILDLEKAMTVSNAESVDDEEAA